MPKQYNIVLVDDHTVVRNGLKQLIERLGNYTVTAEYDNGKHLVNSLPLPTEPDVILLDVAMPVMDGKVTAAWLKEHEIKHPVLILTLDTTDQTIIELFRLGVRGYLPKTCTAEILKRAIDDIVSTGYYHNELLSNALLATERASRKDERQMILDKITEREKLFLQMVCDEQEYTYEQMADILKVHRRTIDGYRESLFDKFNIKSKTGLVLFAMKYRLAEDMKPKGAK